MATIHDVSKRIRELSSQDPEHLDAYVPTIRINAQTDPRVIRHLVDNYFNFGQYHRATQILERSGRLSPSIDELRDLETTLIAVGRTRLKLRTDYDTRPAMSLLRSLENMHIFEQDAPRDNQKIVDIASCERWIRIEACKAALRSDLMKSGDYARDSLIVKTRFWLDKAFAVLANIDDLAARSLELELLEGFSGSSAEEKSKQARLLKFLMIRCPDGSSEETRAIQAYASQVASTSPQEALTCLQTCESRYLRTSNRTGQLVVNCLSFNTNPGHADRFTKYLSLAKQFRALGQLSVAKACVDLADTSIHHDPNRWEKFLMLEAFASPLLDQMGDRQASRDFQVCKCVARTFASPRHPRDLETAIAMLRNLPKNLSPAHEYAVLQCLRDCAATLRHDNDAEHLAQQMLRHHYVQLDYERESALINDISMTAHTRIAAQYQTSLLEHQRDALFGHLSNDIRQLEEYYERDIEHYLFVLAGVKLERLFTYLNTVELRHSQHSEIARIRKDMVLLQYRQRPEIVRPASMLLYSYSGDAAVKASESYLQAAKSRLEYNPMILAEAHLLCAVSRRALLSRISATLPNDTFFREATIIMDYLRQSATFLKDSNASFNDFTRATAPMLDTLYELLELEPGREEYLSEARDFLLTAEQAMMASREMQQSQSNAQTLIQSRMQETHLMRRDFYRRASEFFFRRGLLNDWWVWHERGRSRALLSHLSSSLSVVSHPRPETASAYCQDEPTNATITALHADVELQQNLLAPLPSTASEMLATFHTIFHIFHSIRPDTKIVIVGFHASLTGNVSLVVIDSLSKRSTTISTTMTSRLIEEWYESNLDDPATRLQSHAAALRDLQPLAAALEGVTTEDDLLILIPSFPLDRFPLHAATARTDYLATRNPITYAPSVMLLKHCVERSHSSETTLFGPAFVSAYDIMDEQQRIAESQIEICKRFGYDQPEWRITKAQFENKLQSSKWIHYHGHATFVDGEPLQQSFQLMPDGDTDGRMTVAELLSKRLRDSVVLSVACDSNIQDNNPANEPLGLSSALIIAGAATVIGTLWKTQSRTGRVYSRLFYEELQDQIGSGSEGWLNLAEVIRRAAMRLRLLQDGSTRFNTPDDWAPFVLHGSPFFKFKKLSENAIKQLD